MSTHESPDLIDSLLGLDPQGSTYEARHFRDKVLVGTQSSYDALFSPELTLSLPYRWLVALYACTLSKADELSQHYLQQAQQNGVDAALIQAVGTGQLDAITDPTLKTILDFTAKLILKPIEGDKSAIEAVKQAGISTPDVIALSQLIAFLSYQTRLVAGLKAMQALEQKK